MSVPLKPLSIDFSKRQLDSKQKKFHASIERALQHFDSVTEWADYIASLGKLLKALQSWTPQFQNVKYYVPFPYQVSRRLASSLSPNLPSGVHQKTLEVYNVIFSKIGIDALNKECNIWVPGILPLMAYASISVKGPLVELYEKYLVQLSPSALRLLIKALLASLFPGIDDESSEFQPAVFNLIETLRVNIADESLFWQSCFMIMITSPERRLGGLSWLMKTFPTLNAIPHKVAQSKLEAEVKDANSSDPKVKRQIALNLLLPAAKDVVSPEPGLLIRCLVSCLDEENELLIKRGILDLLLQRINLDSPVLQDLATSLDCRMLVMGCCKTMLSRDVSISRRIWNWLLGPSTINTSQQQQAKTNSNDYFARFGKSYLESGLLALVEDEKTVPVAFRICLAIMDRWEIASHIIPPLFMPLMKAARRFKNNQTILKAASAFFDSVETNIICSHLFQFTIKENDLDLLTFILSCFKVGQDEEIVVRHLPLLLLAILSKYNIFDSHQMYQVSIVLVELIPERAFLPIEHSTYFAESNRELPNVLDVISEYYSMFLNLCDISDFHESAHVSPPFSSEDLTYLLVATMHTALSTVFEKDDQLNDMVDLFVKFMEKVPSTEQCEEEAGTPKKNELTRQLKDTVFMARESLDSRSSDSIFGWSKLYGEYLSSKLSAIESAKLSKSLVSSLWVYLVNPNTQIEAVKCLDSLYGCSGSGYVKSALAYAFIDNHEITSRISALEALWLYSSNTSTLARRPLELVLDELFNSQDPNYLSTSRWVLAAIDHGSANRLFHILCENILTCEVLHKDSLEELDDIDTFVYHCQNLINVLRVEHPTVLHSFNTEKTSVQPLYKWLDGDTSTYKNLAITIASKFLRTKSTTGKSVRTTLLLLDILLDGTEENFQHLVTFLLELAADHFNSKDLESELISVSLLNIISKVLALSHDKQITLRIFEDDTSHLRYIDFLILGVESMKKPLIIQSYVKLLSESLLYFRDSVFSIILPITTSITGCIKKLFHSKATKGDKYQSIVYLIHGLQELMEVSHSYLAVEDSGKYPSAGPSRNDFLQNMVANVFSNDSSGINPRHKHQREIIVQSFKLVVTCCLDIWTWAHGHSKNREQELSFGEVGAFEDSLHHQAYKYKSQSKKLLGSVFALEPLEVLEELISERPDNVSLTLVHALDGNKPVLTLPHLFQGIVYRCNKYSSVLFSNSTPSKAAPNPLLINQLEARTLLQFIFDYLSTLENAAVEEFYNDFLTFMKEITSNSQCYKKQASLLLKIVALVCEKVHKSRFGEDKRVKRELSEVFCKYLPTALGEEVHSANQEVFENLNFVCSKIKYIVIDYPSGDKFNSCLSIIVQSALSPYLKKQYEKSVPKHVMELTLTVSKMGSKVKVWRALINDTFFNDRKFTTLGESELWNEVVFAWSSYPDNQEKLMNELVAFIGAKASTISPNINPFTAWSDSEIETKCHNITRICYLLLVSPKDYYLLCFRSLMSHLEHNLVSDDDKIRSQSFLLLRCVVLQFSSTHFSEYWSTLAYSLQTGLQNFYESLTMQQETSPKVIFQVAKSVDLILTLNFEEFSASYEWLFVIDTMNCIYKTDPYISLADEISDCKDFIKSEPSDFEVAERSSMRVPILRGIHKIERHTQLRAFFHNVSYAHYEEMYALKRVDMQACKADAMVDTFTACNSQ